MKAAVLYQKYQYELIAFLTGASVMVLEIVGARLISPYLGASTYVWTAMIGVILGSLALGFAVGGVLADRRGSQQTLGAVLFVAALFVMLMALFQQSVLQDIAALGLDLRISALLAALVLFAVPSALIGMVSPHLAKIRVTSLDTTGQSIGRLEAAGALGSIAGTFSCGYFLLGLFGSRAIVVGIVVVLLITALLASSAHGFSTKRFFTGLALVLLTLAASQINAPSVRADVDSAYTRYRVVEGVYRDQAVNLLLTDNGGVQSAARVDGSSELVLDYAKRFQAAAVAYPGLSQALLIGGGTYTFPNALIGRLPDVNMDVAEIDPALDSLARQYFGLKQSPRLTIYHSDGRAYLNQNTRTYDMIFMDAFSSLSPPFQLTTRESVQQLHRGLSKDGAAVVNLIGRYDSGNGEYLRALKATYLTSFKYVSFYPVDQARLSTGGRQNFILYATDSESTMRAITRDEAANPLAVKDGGQVLTDDYAPIERLTF